MVLSIRRVSVAGRIAAGSTGGARVDPAAVLEKADGCRIDRPPSRTPSRLYAELTVHRAHRTPTLRRFGNRPHRGIRAARLWRALARRDVSP
jgi:hypothetical protein